MLAVFLATAAWLPALFGLGHLVAERIGARTPGPGVTGLLGLVALAATGTLLHLFVPIGSWAASAAFVLGLAIFVRRWRQIVGGTPLSTWVGMTLALLGFAAASDLPVRHYDMGLYWLQAVRWTVESAQPLGIATLHARLGFNSTWFAVCAMLEHPLAIGKSAFLASALVITLGAWLAAEGVGEIISGRRTLSAWLSAATALLVAACVQHLGGHSPDAATAVVGFASMVVWARAFEREEAIDQVGVAVVLAAFATTVKLSAMVWLAAAPILCLLRRRATRRELLRPDAGAWIAAFLAVWIVKGYVASGCPLFPSTAACLPLPWATPPSIAQEVSGWIRSWARWPGARPEVVLASWNWLPGWAGATWQDPIVRMVTYTLAIGLAGVAALRQRASPGFRELLATAVAGTAFWFWGAPTPRFGWGYLFALALVPTAESAARFTRRPGPWRVIGIGLASLLVAVVIARASLEWVRQAPSELLSIVDWPRIPGGYTREVELPSGLRVRVPLSGDQCWSAPLPCTPYVDPGLSMDGRMVRTATVRPRHP